MPDYVYSPKVEFKLDAKLEAENSSLRSSLREAMEEARSLERQIENLHDSYAELQGEFSNFKAGAGIEELENKLARFEKTARQSAQAFQSFLEASNLKPAGKSMMFGTDAEQEANQYFNDLRDKIRSGSIGLQEAISNVKINFASLFDEGAAAATTGSAFDPAIYEKITSSLEEMGAKLDTVLHKFESFSAGGGAAAGAETAAQSFQQVGESAEKMLSGLDGSSDFAQRLVESLSGISQAATGAVETLSNISTFVQDISKQSLGTTIDITAVNDTGRAIGILKQEVVDYANAVMSFGAEMQSLSLAPQWKEIAPPGSELAREFNALSTSMINFSGNVDSITKGVNNNFVKSASAIQKYADQVRPTAELILQFTEKLSSQGIKINDFDFSKLNAPVISEQRIDELSQQNSDLSNVINQLTGLYRNESAAINQTDQSYSSHVESVAAAAAAEREKMEASESLVQALLQEMQAIEKVAAAAKSDTNTEWHTNILASVQGIQQAVEAFSSFAQANEEAAAAAVRTGEAVGSTNRILDQISQGRFTAELSAIQRSYESLEAPSQQLIANMERLRSAEARMEDTSLSKNQRLESYKEYSTLLQTIQKQIADLSGEESKIAKFTNIQDKLSNQSLSGTLADKENQFKALSVRSVELEGQMNNLRAAFANMVSHNSIGDMDALIRDFDEWKVALAGVNTLMAKDKRESGAFDKSQAQQARDTAAALKELLAIQKEITTVSVQRNSLTGEGFIGEDSDYERLTAKLHELSEAFAELYAKNRENFSDDQTARLEAGWDAYHQKIEEVNRALEKHAKATADADAEKGVKTRTDAYKQLTDYLTQINRLEKQLSNNGVGKNSSMAQELRSLSAEVENFRANLDNMGTEKIGSGLDEVGVKLSSIREGVSGMVDGARMMDSPFYMLETRLTHMISLGAIVMKGLQQVKKMVQEAVSLDTAMTQLRIVTDNTDAEYAAYSDSVASTAKELGASITDMIDSATVFARLGYSLTESSGLAEMVAMLQNVGDIDVSTAQDAVTTMTKAFDDVDATNIEAAMDKLVIVGNNFPISVKQIAEGINNAGSALAAGGNSFDEAVALLTAANTAVQDVSKASTGLRTISARIRRTKFELDDLGETIEEAKYQKALDILSGKNVKLTENGEYRSTYEIMKDLAAVWDELSSMDKAAIAEQLAGTRQQNVFYSLIDQFQEAQNAMDAMGDSTGALRDAYGEYSDSIQRHIDSMKAAFQSLSQSVVDSDLAKSVVDNGTRIIGVIQRVNDALKPIGGFLPVIGGTLMSLLSSMSGKILQMTGLKSLGETLKAVYTAAAGATGAIGKLSAGFGALGIGGQMTLIIAGIAALVAIINKAREAYLATHPTLDMLKKDAENAQEAVNELQEEINTNTERIKELNKLKADGSITDFQIQELASLERENEKLKEQLELRKQIAEYKTGVVKETEGEQNRREVTEFFSMGRTHGVKDELTGETIEGVALKSTEGFGGILNAIDDYNSAEQNYIAARDALSDALKESREKGEELTESDREKLNGDINDARSRVQEEAQNLRLLKDQMMELADRSDITLGQRASLQALIGKLSRALGQSETSYDKLSLRDLSETQIKRLSGVEDIKQFSALLSSDKDLEKHVKYVIDQSSFEQLSAEQVFYYTIDRDALEEELRSIGEGGNVDLLVRPVIDAKELVDAGWEKAGEGAATLFSSTYTDTMRTKAANFTPIFTDEDGKVHIFTEKELTRYAEDVMNGVREDDLGLQIGAEFTKNQYGDLFKEEAEATAKRTSELHGILFADEIAALEQVGEAADNTSVKIQSFTERTKQLKESIAALNSFASESLSDSGLSLESVEKIEELFGNMEGFDAEEFFELTSTGIRANREELEKFTEQYYELEKAKIDRDIKDLTGEANDLYKQLLELTDAEAETAEAQEMLEKYQGLMTQIEQARMARAEIEGMTSAYQQYLNVKGQKDERAPYETVGSDYKGIKDLIDKGWINDPEVTKYLDLIYGNNRSGNNVADFDRLSKKISGTKFSLKDFFTDSSDGAYNFLDAVEQLQKKGKLSGKDFVTRTKGGGYKFDFSSDRLFEVADALGMSVDAVQILEHALRDAGFDVTFDTMADDAARAAYELKKLAKDGKDLPKGLDKGVRDYFKNFSLSNIDTEKEINTARENVTKLLDAMRGSDGKIDMSMPGAEEAVEILRRLIEMKNQITKVDIPVEVSDSEAVQEILDIQKKIEELNALKTEVEIRAVLGEDTSILQARIQEILNELSGNETVTADLKIDTSTADTAISTWKTSVENNTVTQNVVARMTSAPTVSDTTSEVDVTADTSAYDRVNTNIIKQETKPIYFSPNTTAYDSIINNILRPETKTITIITKNESSGSSEGTAHAGGTASAKGNWGAKKNEISLVGEVGPEIRVRNGRWELLGANSAELASIRKGDIIFNAEQTRQILRNGKITNGMRRGISYVGGTAYDSGTGPGRRRSTAPDYNYTGAGDSAGKGDAKKKKAKQKIDWIEVAVDRIERIIESMTASVESAFLRLQKRLQAASDAIQKTREEIDLARKGAERYFEEAEKVKLSDEIKELIRNGAIDITQYSKATAEKIKEYQEWYEKGLDLVDKIDELHEDLANLYRDRFDMIEKDYENQIGVLDHQVAMQQKNLDMIGAKGYLESINFYQEMAEVERTRISKLRREINDLNEAFGEALDSGEIETNSEEWYEYINTINSVEEAIADANIQLQEYANTIRETKWSWFDYALDRMERITDETDFLIDLIDKHKLFDDNGKVNDYGLATIGMRAVNYDTYMSRAEKYMREMKSVEQELASDPYNQKLIDRREALLDLQRSSILAAEQEKEAVKDLVESGFKAELDALKELIDAYEEALDSEKDLYDYQKKISDKSANISSLQKQLAAFANDNSEENRARMQKLQESLKEAQEDLTETEYDKYVEDQKEMLDKLYEEYERLLNNRLDDVDQLMRDMIEVTNENSASIKQTLIDAGEEVGYTLEQQLADIFGTSGSATRYHDEMTHGISAVEAQLETISNMVDTMVTQSSGIRAYATGGLVSYTGLAHLDGTPTKPELVLNADDTKHLLEAVQMTRITPMSTSSIGSVIPISAIRNGLGGSSGAMEVNNYIEIERVLDYNDFVSQLQRDKQFENMMKDAITGTSVGKNSLSKYKYKFG